MSDQGTPRRLGERIAGHAADMRPGVHPVSRVRVYEKEEIVCPVCKVPREVHKSDASAMRAGRWSGRCKPCSTKAVQKVWEERAKALPKDEICRHCERCKVNRPKGLCWGCYYAPGVRELYPSTSKYAKRGVGNFAGEAPLADAPTTAAPGTPEKIAVMEGRAAVKRALFHPADARFEGDWLPLEFLANRLAA